MSIDVPTTSATDPAPPRHKRPVRPWIFAVAGLLVFAIALWFAVNRFGNAPTQGSEAAPAAASSETSASGTPADFVGEGSLAMSTEVINDLVAFVEENAGRPYLRPPVLVGQSDGEFREKLTADFEADNTPEMWEQAVRFYQATGATTLGSSELRQAIIALIESGVQGYYDSGADKLYVPTSSGDTPEDRAILVHELAHALDDQYADLDAYIASSETAGDALSPETTTIARWVIEGRANTVEQAWRAANGLATADDHSEEAEDVAETTSPADEGAHDAEPDLPEGFPVAFAVELELPYAIGGAYIAALGGASQTWDRLETLPASTEQLFDTVDVDGEDASPDEPGTASAPRGEGEVLRRWTFGSADLVTMIVGDPTFDGDSTDSWKTLYRAAEGWRAGEAILTAQGSQSCARIALTADDGAALAAMNTTLTTWAGGNDARTVEQASDTITVSSCAPYVP